MLRNRMRINMVICYCIALVLCITAVRFGSDAVTVWIEHSPTESRTCIAIDAGHGGIDGGAVSISGMPESQINLEIAARLQDLLRLLGYKACMLRSTDTSLHTEGTTIRAQKMSDLKQRALMVENMGASLLISIHQNTFSNRSYSGAQVFYRSDEESRTMAHYLQENFIKTVNPTSNRKPKIAKGIYLMEHIPCPGVLIECGFLTNVQEEALLQDANYQKVLCAVIASTVSNNLTQIKPSILS